MATLPADTYRDASDDDTWDAQWRQFQDDMQRHADADSPASQIGEFITSVTRVAESAATAPSAPAPEPDPVLQGWLELQQRRRGRNAAPADDRDAVRQRWLQGVEQPAEPEPMVGLSPLAQELEREGFFDQLATQHAAERAAENERARQQAIRESAEAAAQEAARYGGGGVELYPGQGEATRNAGAFFSEIPRWLGVSASQVPGGFVGLGGSVLQAPDVTVSGVEHAGQAARLRQIEIMNRIDRGERVRPVDDIYGYQDLTPDQRARTRAIVESEIAAFNPTPIEQRTLYRAGETVQQFGRTLHERMGFPLPEGYDEQSFAVQLGRGLGSMLAGMPATVLAGPLGGAAFFGAAGMGEATQRAVEFDRAERASGRPGLSQEQIILAGIAGVAPGTTDILPVEVLLQRLRLPGMTGFAASTLAQVIARVGGQVVTQALVEGGQEGAQQIVQNLIAQRVYNPTQELTEDVWWNAVVGAGVGAESEIGRIALQRLARLGRGRGRVGSPAPQPRTAAPEQGQGQTASDLQERLSAEFRRMMPADVELRFANRLQRYGYAVDELVAPPSPFQDRWLLSVALERGEDIAKLKGFHGLAAHVLRGYAENGLYSYEEWATLLDAAKRSGVQSELQRERTAGGNESLWDAYTRAYAQHGPTRQAEYLNQELVGRLAEKWASGTSYGGRVDTLLARITNFLQAVRNAARGMGFQTADDVLKRVVSGEVGQRAANCLGASAVICGGRR